MLTNATSTLARNINLFLISYKLRTHENVNTCGITVDVAATSTASDAIPPIFTLYPFLRRLDGLSRIALAFSSRRRASDIIACDAFLSRAPYARYIYSNPRNG